MVTSSRCTDSGHQDLIMTTYNTNLASEFYVLSMLYRLGIDASLTLGNKKAVDILIANSDETVTTIDVKGVAAQYDWPADNIHKVHDKHFYVLVCFNGKISDPLSMPTTWVVPSLVINEFMKTYKTRTVISRMLIKSKGDQYMNKWDVLEDHFVL